MNESSGAFMKHAIFGLAMGCLLAAGCATVDGPEESNEGAADPVDGVETAGAPADVAVVANETPMRLERVRRALDRGEVKDAEVELERLAEITPAGDEKDEILLELSRAYEMNGDTEGAIEVVESLLVANATRARYDARESAEKRLRFLLTGEDEEKALPVPASDKLVPITAALAEHFQPDADGRVLVQVFAFGHRRGNHDGIFEIAEAKRHILEQDLTSNVKVSQSISSSGSWIALPSSLGEDNPTMPQADRSMLIFFYDLGDNRVPSRYDTYLPMPSDDIAAILEGGDGVVMARERPNGKPVIVIAAPRPAQIETVEKAFAQMSEIPLSPVIVPLEQKLTSGEIQAVVRSGRKAMAKCYEDARKRDASLTGKMLLEFAIDGDGRVVSSALGKGSTLVESGLTACVLGGVDELRFPASGKKATVTYPIEMTP